MSNSIDCRAIPAVPFALQTRRRIIKPDNLKVGQIYFNRYLITSLASRQGGMSTVYRALDLKKIQKMDVNTLNRFGLASLKRADLLKIGDVDVDPRSLGLKMNLKILDSAAILCGCRVVIKCAARAEPLEYLRNEAKILEDLNGMPDPRFPEFVEFAPLPDSLTDRKGNTPSYLVMQDVGKVSLLDLLKKRGASLSELIDLVCQMLETAKRLHTNKTEHKGSRDYVHRDLKLSNIMATADDYGIYLRVVDFGISCESGYQEEGMIVAGTPKYMAPEALLGRKIDKKFDIYSIGVLLYYLITRNNPMNGENKNKTIDNQIDKPMPDLPMEALTKRFKPEKITAFGPVIEELHERLNFVVQGTTQKDKDDRFGNVDAILRELKEAKRLAKMIEVQ